MTNLMLEVGAEVIIDFPSEVFPSVDDPHAHWIVAQIDGGEAELYRPCGRVARTTLSNLTVVRSAADALEIWRAERRVMERLRARCDESARAAACRMIADAYEED